MMESLLNHKEETKEIKVPETAEELITGAEYQKGAVLKLPGKGAAILCTRDTKVRCLE